MAAPSTAKFEHLALQVETAVPGTYATLCGMKGFTISREAQVNTVEVPADCTDESLPYSRERAVQALDFTVEAEAVWARENHQILLDWFRSGATKNIRIKHGNVATGATEYESGPALLTKLTHVREKGQKITANISVEFDGTPTVTAKP